MTIAKERIRNELESLKSDGQALLYELASENEKKFKLLEFGQMYQNWYTTALPVVKFLAPDRYAEFVSCYDIDPKRREITVETYAIRDFLMGNLGPIDYLTDKPDRKYRSALAGKLWNQVQIITALAGRVDEALAAVEFELLAESQDSELEVARTLMQISLRAAGAVAGVVLEGHLKHVAASRDLIFRKRKPTIGDFNDKLKAENVIDQPTWRRIQYLADIRNLCDHVGDQEPKQEQILELIDGTSQIVKTIL